MSRMKADVLIFIVTICWGSSYLFMKVGLGTIEEFSLIALRFGLAFIIAGLLFYRRLLSIDRGTIFFSMILGLILFLVFTSITFGLKTTTTSNAGFLVSLTVIFVPLIQAAIYRNRLGTTTIISILLALIGIALLTVKFPIRIAFGDFLCAMAAFFYATHITIVGIAAKRVDSLNIGILQLGFAGFFGLIFSLLFESPTLPSTAESWTAILVLSIICSALGFILQTVAQKYTTPTRTGLIFSMEPVFAALLGFLFMKEVMSSIQILGAFLVLISIIFTTIKGEK